MHRILAALFLAALAIASPALAQTIPSYSYPSAGTPPSVQLQCNDTYTACLPITSANPVPSASLPSANSTAGTAAGVTAVASSSFVAKASPGNLYGVNVTSGASAGYVLIYNRTTAPADGVVTPARCIPLAANTGIELTWRPVPLYFSTGIVVAFSTTGCFTQTLSATAFIAVDDR